MQVRAPSHLEANIVLDVIYFSSFTDTTHRFVQKLEARAQRIALRRGDPAPDADRPYLLITPTYGGGHGKGAVPKQVIKFLNDPDNRALLRGVVAAGNRNFGAAYALAGPIIAAKCEVPLLHTFELMGMPSDVADVQQHLTSTAPDQPGQ